jgi:hypothetical protein
MQMIAGGVLLVLAAAVTGEVGRFDPARVTLSSFFAFAYLTLFGSLVGFTAYVWLLQVSTPARVSTYAFVNPFIAVLLGWLVLREPISSGVVTAGAFDHRSGRTDHDRWLSETNAARLSSFDEVCWRLPSLGERADQGVQPLRAPTGATLRDEKAGRAVDARPKLRSILACSNKRRRFSGCCTTTTRRLCDW